MNWRDQPCPQYAYHLTKWENVAGIMEKGFEATPFGNFFSSTVDDAAKFMLFEPDGAKLAAIVICTEDIEFVPSNDHSAEFFGEDTTSWMTIEAVPPEAIAEVHIVELTRVTRDGG